MQCGRRASTHCTKARKFRYSESMVRLIVCALLVLAPLRAAGGEPLTKYFVAFLYKGPKFAAAAADSPERKLNHEQHVAYIEEMRAAGKLVTFGPILDGG